MRKPDYWTVRYDGMLSAERFWNRKDAEEYHRKFLKSYPDRTVTVERIS